MTEPTVNVAILSAQEIKFDLYGDFLSPNVAGTWNGKFSAKFENGYIKLSGTSTDGTTLREIIFHPTDFNSDSFLLRDVLIGINFHWEKKENQRFLGSLKLIIEDGKLTVINLVPAEQYLMSVISSEMSANSSIELLKAHAIISRSWLLAQIQKRKQIANTQQQYFSEIKNENERIRWYDREDHTLFDVCADDHCQRYQGITRLFAHNAQASIEETNGMVLTSGGKICDARFSKSCGGITESFENVWEPVEHSYLKTLVDYKFSPDDYEYDLREEESAEQWINHSPPAFCNTHDVKILSQVLTDYDQKTKDFYRWEVDYSQNEISELVKAKSGIDFGSIIDLIPVERGYSGRLIKLKIIGSKQSLIIGKELEIRKTLSKTHLYSSAFIIEKSEIENGIPQKFKLRGAGWGHGVGLCQIGAAVMGEMGYRFDEILLHYYKDATIKKIY